MVLRFSFFFNALLSLALRVKKTSTGEEDGGEENERRRTDNSAQAHIWLAERQT